MKKTFLIESSTATQVGASVKSDSFFSYLISKFLVPNDLPKRTFSQAFVEVEFKLKPFDKTSDDAEFGVVRSGALPNLISLEFANGAVPFHSVMV